MRVLSPWLGLVGCLVSLALGCNEAQRDAPSAPDCARDSCTGEFRWRLEPGESGSATVQLGGVFAERGVLLFSHAAEPTRLEGSGQAAPVDLDVGPSIVHLDVDGSLLEQRARPGSALADEYDDALSVVGDADHDLFFVQTDAASGATALHWLREDASTTEDVPQPSQVVAVSAQRSVWFARQSDRKQQLDGCDQGATLLERHAPDGALRSRSCLIGVRVRELRAYPGGVVAMLEAHYPVFSTPEKVDINLGAGTRSVAPDTSLFAAWSDTGRLHWFATLGAGQRATLWEVGLHGDVWLSTGAATRDLQRLRIDTRGRQTAQPYTSTGILRIDSAGYAVQLSEGDDTPKLRKLSPSGQVVWERELEGPSTLSAKLALDQLGNISVVNLPYGTLTQYAP